MAIVAALSGVALAEAGDDEYGATAKVRGDVRGEEVAASDFRLELGELARVPRDNAQKLLTLAPGILLTNHGGEGHTASMYLRGFDAGEGEDVELSVDGVPLNEISNHHGHGYADLTFLLPEVVREVRVVEGPFDPVQGDFAVAGSAEYALGMATPGVLLSSRFGSFRRRRAFVGVRPGGERARTFLAAAFERGDGFGVNRAFAQGTTLAQYEAKVSAGTFVRTLAFFSAQRWDSAGVVPERAYHARALPCASTADRQFFCTYDPNQGGSGQRAGVSTILERSRGSTHGRAQLFVTTRGLRTKENFTGYTLDPRIDGGPQRGDLRDGRTQALTLGLRGNVQSSTQWLGRAQLLALGVYARHDLTTTAMERVRRELDVPYLVDFDRDVRQTNVATYLRVDVRPFERLRVMLGARADAFAFHVLDLGLPTVDRIGTRLSREASDAYGFALSPRALVELALLRELRWLLSIGQGARSSDATALSEAESAPFARVTAAESGFAFAARHEQLALEARSTVFFTRVSRDLVFDAEAGRNQPVGASHRSGALVMSRVRLATWCDVLGSATYTRGHLPPRESEVYELFRGPRLPFVPTWLVRGDAVVSHALPLPELHGFASLGLTYVGRRPLPLGEWASPYHVLDLSVGARYGVFELTASVTNLADARYRESELNYISNFDPTSPRSMTPSRHFSAGAPRQWLLSLALAFDPQAFGGSL